MLNSQSKITCKVTSNQKGLVIAVEGYLNGNLQQAFREAFESRPRFEKYAVSFQHCLGLDSGGLGLLLLLRDYAKAEKQSLLITDCSPEVLTVLRYANFDQIFTIVN